MLPDRPWESTTGVSSLFGRISAHPTDRDDRSRRAYTLAIVGFGVITIYMTVRPDGTAVTCGLTCVWQFSALFLAFNGLNHIPAGKSFVSNLFTNHIFLDIVISLSATFGLYLVSSLLFVRCAVVSMLRGEMLMRETV